jgi:hypothetical protein
MELRSRVFGVVLAGLAGLAVVASAPVESQASRDICMSIPGACDYAPETAPSLNAEVCYDGNTVTLKGTGSCAPGSYPFWVSSGEVVDPQTSEVQPYIPLPDACDMGFCVPGDGDPGEPGAMCCDPSSGTCTETDSICPTDEIAVWCQDGETATLGENGEWECHSE